MDKKVNYITPYHWDLLRFWRKKHEYPIKLIPGYLKKSDKLLDIGCGDGKLTSLLADRVGYVYAVDNQERALSFARILIPNKNVTLMNADANSLPFRKGEFNIVTAFDVIEHIPSEERSNLILEVKRVLRENGFFILTTPNRKNLRHLFWGRWLKSPFHYQEFSVGEMRDFLWQHGFNIIAEQGIYLPPPIPNIEHFSRIIPFVYLFLALIPLGKISIRLSETFLFVAGQQIR